MRMKISVSAASVALVVVCSVTASLAQTSAPKRSITEKDIFDFVWVADPQLAPDGAHVVFTRVSMDGKRTGYETSIWMVSTSGGESPVRLTNGKQDSHARWSPDGNASPLFEPERRTNREAGSAADCSSVARWG